MIMYQQQLIKSDQVRIPQTDPFTEDWNYSYVNIKTICRSTNVSDGISFRESLYQK